MMQTRTVGRTGIRLSVIGAGTAQLQMLPERQAIDTLLRAFELGVNWVHTAPDYGGIDPWIHKAIVESRREIAVLSAGPLRLADLPAFFENTCHVYQTPRLALYGLAGIEDIEWYGENVWGAGGMIEYLQARKAEGRLGGIYCSTHSSADYVEKLITSGVFDAIMLAWNPLGFHQQSHPYARARLNREYEDLGAYGDRIFPLAAERGVSLLIMKPFAGGLLCKGKAMPPHDWFATGAEPVAAADVLRLVLEQPAVCAVVPGLMSAAEAEENARAGHAPLEIPDARRTQLARSMAAMRASLCSRCGKCESTCSHNLQIPAMFREAYVWTLRNETNQATAGENYFDLHPDATLTCATCSNQTCVCPQGLHIPSSLTRIHGRMQALRTMEQHPGPSAAFAQRVTDGAHRVLVHTADVPRRATSGATSAARFLVQNMGDDRWMASQHTPDRSLHVGIGVVIDDRLSEIVPLRNTVCPTELSPVAFEFRAPARAGARQVDFCLTPLHPNGDDRTTVFHSTSIIVDGTPDRASRVAAWPAGVEYLVRRAVRKVRGRRYARARGRSTPPAYGASGLEHSLPAQAKAGVTYGIRLTIINTGTMTWYAQPPDGRRVYVNVSFGGTLAAVLPLPRAEVPPGQTVTLHFPLRAPDEPGFQQVRVELVHHGVTMFAGQGVEPWIIPIEVVSAPTTESVRLLEISRKHNPWYYNPLNGIPESRQGHPFPLFIPRAKGCRAWDAEGHEYIDYTMGWGATILGHADDRIQRAIAEMLDCGTVLPFPHPVEMDVTRMLIEQFPGNDMVTFGKNGSDVCSIAARLARVVTGKTVILSCGFHGWQDFALDYFRFEDCGIPDRPARSLYKFTFNDRAGFFELYERHKHDLAAVMIEPAGPWVGDHEGLGGEADPDFLRTIADAARRVNALVIFDEIVTGFRYREGSVQKATGVTPDLTCLGKALASGMPLAALLGPYRIFLEHFHKTHFCPTFRGEAYSLAAARAAIEIYRREPVADRIWSYGESLRRGIHEICRDTGVDAEMSGPPFRMAFVFREGDPSRRQLKKTLLMQELLKQRVITVTGMMLPSTAHDDAAMQQTFKAFAQALELIAHADRRNELDRHIELALL